MIQYGSLSTLFASGNLPVVASDSYYVLRKFEAAGFESLPLSCLISDSNDAPPEILLVTVDHKQIPSPQELHTVMGDSAVLLAPLLSFCANQRSVDYFVSRLKKIDFVSACAASRRRIDQFQDLQKPLLISSSGCQLSVVLGDNLEVFAPKLVPEIKPGEWISVSQFLEIALIPNEDYSCFRVNGNLSCEGISIAVHQKNYETSKPLAKKAWDILSEIRSTGGFPLVVVIDDSKVVEITTQGGDNVLAEIEPLTDKTFHGFLIEVGFASQLPDPGIDWTVNSQLNEGAGGVHVALGTGVDAAHIDFISPRAKVLN